LYVQTPDRKRKNGTWHVQRLNEKRQIDSKHVFTPILQMLK
jgi:hypothetical protein